MNKRIAVVITCLIVVAGAVAIYLASPTDMQFLRSTSDVEVYLLGHTPIGTPQADVLRWLETRGKTARVRNVTVPKGSEYPLSRLGGDSFIHETIGSYGIGLRTYVEAFYTFDRAGRVVEVRVRKTGP